MDFWKSEYEERESTPVLAGLQELVDSPNLSSNSIEYSSDSLTSDQTEISKAILTSKATLLAKKRLQAYYTVNKFKVGSVKEQKNDSVSIEKTPKPSFKKVKKTVYPDEAAKAVIRDIEILKRAGYGYGPKGPSPALPSDIIVPTDPIVPISLLQLQNDSPAISLISEEDNLFKRREIKCRNIRKSDLYRRRSVSPKSRHDRSGSRKKDKKAYPVNWTEYKEMELNTHKNLILKSKLQKNPKDKKFELKKYFNFQTHPVPIETYKSHSKTGDTVCVPFPYLRYTASKPQILYSTNQRVTSSGHPTREQLFALIPKERKLIIEKLGKSSRCEADNKALTARKWYPKNWKRIDNTEAKLLENSVGLSFLQSYSDEEEEDEEQNTFEGLNQEIVSIIEGSKEVALVEENKDKSIFKDEFEFPQEKELSPSATPKTVPSNLEENLVDEVLQEDGQTKKSKWDDPSDTTELNDDKTPPIGVDKEEGEVLSDEEQKNRKKCAIDEYEKTKEELEKLEAVLKSSTNYLDNVGESKEIATKSENNKKTKKKRKKVHGDKISKSKNQKRKSKKKVEKKNKDHSSSSSVPSQSEEDKSKKRKQKKKKKDSKTKYEKDKKRKTKKKKDKKEKTYVSSEKEEDLDEVTVSENNLPKKKKKRDKIEGEKIRKRTVSGDSRNKVVVERKNSLDTTTPEDYEDDIKFFAARFDAEDKLKGKTKHKTKTNITLEELAVHPKVEEKPVKRKLKAENCEPEGFLSPETVARKKNDQQKKNKEKEKLGEETAKREEIKVDLLKMNEDYLREQKRKEEKESFLPNEQDDGQDSKKFKHLPKEKTKIDTNSEKEVVEILEPDDTPVKAAIIDPDKSDGETVETVLENIVLDTSNHANVKANRSLKEGSHPDWEHIRNKRKRMSAGAQEKSEKKPKRSLSPKFITLHNIKQEKDTTADRTIDKNNSWESDEDLFDLEIPLNIKPFSRREIKAERDISNPEDHPREQPDLVLVEEEITNQFYQPQAEVEFQFENKIIEEVECIDLECDVQTPPKKTRWDIKASASTPIFKLEKPDEIIDLDANNSNNCITLENEYEEFMKAVTSTKKESPNVDSNSDCSLIFVEETHQEMKDEPPMKNLEEFSPISTLQIPLPPVKSEQLKPVPVPSPKLEAVLDLNKPLINLSVSANVTQNITLSLATSVPSISAPITSSIDISQPCVEISAPLMNDMPINMTSYAPLVADSQEADLTLGKDEEGTNQKLVFTSLTLPSKKLLDNSKLNLGDSDNDDQSTVEELKRKKLEALIEDNKREALHEQAIKLPIVPVAEGTLKTRSPISKPISSKEDTSKKASTARRAETSPKRGKRESSPSVRRPRDSPVRRRESSPRRRSSPARRKSPRRSPKRRSPVRRKKSPVRRSISPRRRRISISPRRRPSPKRKRSPSPKSRHSPSRLSPRNKRTNPSKENRLDTSAPQRKSSGRHRETSPLKRSVADSTISDDQLPQVNTDYSDPVLPKQQLEKERDYQSPKRVPLDVRISQALGYGDPSEASPKSTSSTAQFYHNEPPPLQQRQEQQPQQQLQQQQLQQQQLQQQPQHQQYQFNEQYSSIQSQVTTPTLRNTGTARTPQSTYRQVGNMLQIVPTDNLTDIPMPQIEMSPDLSIGSFPPVVEQIQTPQQHGNLRSKILQVGNMLQIVPTEMVPTELIPIPPVHTEIKTEIIDESWMETFIPASPEKPSAEASMLLKVAERRAERENRRQEREKRRKEKERRRKEKEKARQAKLKVKTENMIKRALELEQEEEEEDAESDTLGDQHVQWPPIPIVVNHTISKEIGRSILINSYARQLDEPFLEERKSKAVQFADGIRPGEGTSPSAGEDLCSPPPPKKKLPKEKRFKKMKFGKKSSKKKVKVKIIKKPPSPLDESDSDDNLPPPSPPPGSPPPHVFPPRIKVNPVNNVPSAYLASIIQTAQQQQQQPQLQQQQQQQQQAQYPSNLYRTPINLMMAPPPPPQGLLSSVPSHIQSPHGAAMPPTLSPQTHYHPGISVPPPPPPPSHSTGSARSLWDQDGMPMHRYRPRT